MMAREKDERPWGRYEVLDEGANFKVKRIEVKPGGRLSLQSHENRSEHWVVVSGEALVTVGDKEIALRANQDILIPRQARHRVANPGNELLVFIEVQCGSYLGEDDIKRYEDDYDRANS
jgi:mannose-6-phosphate isomerase-like protein (cupin superfamily)